MFSPESLCNLVNAIQIIQKRNAMERSGETCSWTYYFPWLVGFGENFRVSMRAWMVANGVKPEDHSGVSFVMPKYLPSSWMAGMRVVIGISLATAVKALCKLQAVRGRNSSTKGSK